MVKIEFHKRFISGFLMYAALSSLQQDYWGMEGTIRHVVNDWVPWQVTVPLSVAAIVLAVWLNISAEREGK